MLARQKDDAYRKGFYDGLNANKLYPHTISIAGYDFEQILDLVLKDQESKMKEDAVTIKGFEVSLSYLQELGRASGKFDLIPRPKTVKVIDVVDNDLVEIKRNGVTVYKDIK